MTEEEMKEEINRLQEEIEALRNENIALRVASHLPKEKQQWAYDTIMGICVQKGGANG